MNMEYTRDEAKRKLNHLSHKKITRMKKKYKQNTIELKLTLQMNNSNY